MIRTRHRLIAVVMAAIVMAGCSSSGDTSPRSGDRQLPNAVSARNSSPELTVQKLQQSSWTPSELPPGISWTGNQIAPLAEADKTYNGVGSVQVGLRGASATTYSGISYVVYKTPADAKAALDGARGGVPGSRAAIGFDDPAVVGTVKSLLAPPTGICIVQVGNVGVAGGGFGAADPEAAACALAKAAVAHLKNIR